MADLNIKVPVKNKNYNKKMYLSAPWFESTECFLCLLDMGNYDIENNGNHGECTLQNK